MSVSQCELLAQWRHVLGLDIGRVMSSMLESNDLPLHTYCDEGLYSFLILYNLVFGLENLVIVSRVNAPIWPSTRPDWPSNPHHWVRRFVGNGLGLFDDGLPEENVLLVNYYKDKGLACLLYTSDAADDTPLCRSRWSPYH